MCGLVYVRRKDRKPAYKAVLKRYRKQANRGKEGYGYVAIHDNQVVSYQRATTEHEIVKLLSRETASEILFHHRNPTSTPNVDESAHPLFITNPAVLDKTYFIAHNGVIHNDDKLKPEHEKLGFVYSTEIEKGFITKRGEKYVEGVAWNDTEAIAVETAMVMNGKKETIDTYGSAAVIGIETEGTRVLRRFLFRNVNPLNHENTREMTCLTSTGAGDIVTYSKVFLLKEDGTLEATEVQAPASFHYTPPAAGYGQYNDWRGESDFDKWGRRTLPPTTQAMVPASHYTPQVLDFEDETLDMPLEYTDVHKIAKIILERNAKPEILARLTEDQLYTEWETTDNVKDALEDEIARLDSWVNDTDRLPGDIVKRRESLESKREAAEEYADKVQNQINLRSAYAS